MKEYVKNWFSNMIPFDDPLILDGITYDSVENYYQAMKSTDPKDHKYIACLSPSQSKSKGRKLPLRENWNDETKQKFMRFALEHKFRLDTSHGQKLLETGDEEIVEWNNWGDTYWGKTLDGKGSNHLGRLLMNIRGSLQTQKLLVSR